MGLYTHLLQCALAWRKRLHDPRIRQCLIIGPNRQETHVGRTGFQVRIDTLLDLFLATPGHDGIDQSIATAIFKLFVLPAQCFSSS